jgi:hypothetical protein
MREIISNLQEQLALITEQKGEFNAPTPYFDSSEETRQMVISSLFEQALSQLRGSIAQLEILNSKLY